MRTALFGIFVLFVGASAFFNTFNANYLNSPIYRSTYSTNTDPLHKDVWEQSSSAIAEECVKDEPHVTPSHRLHETNVSRNNQSRCPMSPATTVAKTEELSPTIDNSSDSNETVSVSLDTFLSRVFYRNDNGHYTPLLTSDHEPINLLYSYDEECDPDFTTSIHLLECEQHLESQHLQTQEMKHKIRKMTKRNKMLEKNIDTLKQSKVRLQNEMMDLKDDNRSCHMRYGTCIHESGELQVEVNHQQHQMEQFQQAIKRHKEELSQYDQTYRTCHDRLVDCKKKIPRNKPHFVTGGPRPQPQPGTTSNSSGGSMSAWSPILLLSIGFCCGIGVALCFAVFAVMCVFDLKLPMGGSPQPL